MCQNEGVVDQGHKNAYLSLSLTRCDVLEKLFQFHPRWKNLKNKLENGSTWNLQVLNEKPRMEDLNASIIRGNHKSAVIHSEFLVEGLSKEIKKGWELLIPLSEAKINFKHLVTFWKQ